MYRQPSNLRLTRRGRTLLAALGIAAYLFAYAISGQGKFNPHDYDYYANSTEVFVGAGNPCPPYSMDPVAGSDGVCFPG